MVICFSFVKSHFRVLIFFFTVVFRVYLTLTPIIISNTV